MPSIRSGTNRSAKALIGEACLITVPVLAALSLAALLYFFSPLKDPVSVVGLPLIDGYSERNEQASFLLFVVSCGLLSALLSRHGSSAGGSIPRLSAFTLLMPAVILCSYSPYLSALVLVLLSIFIYLIGAAARSRLDWKLIGLVGIVGLIVWGWHRRAFQLVLEATPLFIFMGLLLYGALILWEWRSGCRLKAAAARATGAWISVLLFAGAFSNPITIGWTVIGVLGIFLGWKSGKEKGISAWFHSDAWISFVLALTLVLAAVPALDLKGLVEPIVQMLTSAFAAYSLCLLIHPPSIASLSNVANPILVRRTAIVAAFAAITLLIPHKPWLGLMTVMMASVIVYAGAHGNRRQGSAMAIVFLLWLSFAVPGTYIRPYDYFHDGQLLSASWEFEQGRTLYSEVFPLRAYEFWVTWLGRQVLPHGPTAYFLFSELFQFLPIVGMFLLTNLWTKNALWSLATSFVLIAGFSIEIRMGMQLWFAVAALACLRSTGILRWTGLGLLGCLVGLLGFDAQVPTVGASAIAALAVSGVPDVSRKQSWALAVLRSLTTVMVMVGSYSGLILLWQGKESLFSYFELMAGYSRFYPAFYGLPLPWSNPSVRPVMLWTLFILGSWLACGVKYWNLMHVQKRVIWLFLLSQSILIAPRALGRSDHGHVAAMVYPCIVMASIGIHESLLLLRRQGYRGMLYRPGTVAWAAVVVAVWLTPLGKTTPLDLVAALDQVYHETREWPPPKPSLGPSSRRGEYLWDIEWGLNNFLASRPNPTRHAIAYCIGWPEEQRRAVADLKRHPPSTVVWQFEGIDFIPNPLRYYVIFQHLAQHYQPHSGGDLLIPMEPSWPGMVDLPAGVSGPLRLKHLPLRWGEELRPLRARSIARSKSLDEWQLSDAASPLWSGEHWMVNLDLNPRPWNYLTLELTVEPTDASASQYFGAHLAFAPEGRSYDQQSQITFTALADGKSHRYWIPVGCSPGWVWRTKLSKLSLTVPIDYRIAAIQGNLEQIDEINPPYE